MKILHVLPALTKGGAEKVVVDLANETSMQGHEVTVLVGYNVDPILLRNSLSSTVNFRTIYSKRHSKILNYIFLAPWILKNWNWILKFDVLHCHLSMGAAFGSLAYGFRKLLTSRNFIIIETNHSVGMPLKFIQRIAFEIQSKFRDGYVLMAENIEWMKVLGGNKKLITEFIPNGVQLQPKFCDAHAKANFKNQVGICLDNSYIIGNIGRLVADRRPLILLDIFSKIANEISDFATVHFLMGGEGPQKNILEEKILSLGLKDTIFLPGLINNPILAMSTMDLYISLNVGQVTGIAGIEAASQGIPVIALQMTSDYIANDSDWIWSSTNPESVASKACELLKDEILRKKISEAQMEYVKKHYDSKIMAQSYNLFYTKVSCNLKSQRFI